MSLNANSNCYLGENIQTTSYSPKSMGKDCHVDQHMLYPPQLPQLTWLVKMKENL